MKLLGETSLDVTTRREEEKRAKGEVLDALLMQIAFWGDDSSCRPRYEPMDKTQSNSV